MTSGGGKTMNTKSYFTLKNDFAFKQVFSEEKFLKDFLDSFFRFIKVNRHVVKVEAIPQALIKAAYIKGKLFFGDVVVTLDDHTIISLEMYNLFKEEEFKKSLGYITRLFSNQLEETDKHIEASKVIGINLIHGNYNYNNFDFVNDYAFINKKSYGTIKDEYLEMFLVRLDLIEEIRYTSRREERFIRWIRLIHAKDVLEMEKIAKGDKIMEETVAFVKKFLNNREILEKYDKMNTLLEQAEDAGVAKGICQGIELGEKNKQVAIAKNLLKMNMPIADIETATGLGEKEIKALI